MVTVCRHDFCVSDHELVEDLKVKICIILSNCEKCSISKKNYTPDDIEFSLAVSKPLRTRNTTLRCKMCNLNFSHHYARKR